jgi:hypothetical protein
MVCSEFAAHGWKVALSAAFPVFAQIIANEQSVRGAWWCGRRRRACASRSCAGAPAGARLNCVPLAGRCFCFPLPFFFPQPKDNYQANMYDPGRFTPANCPGGLQTTPGGAYCQIMGQYVQQLNDYNSVPVYAGMNNFCPSQWPEYVRCPPGNPTCC